MNGNKSMVRCKVSRNMYIYIYMYICIYIYGARRRIARGEIME